MQTTHDGAAQKKFHITIGNKNWELFTQDISKIFDSERNKNFFFAIKKNQITRHKN